jgi:hypothetical protein
MIRHSVEAIVQYGEFATFAAAVERHQKLATDYGLEPYTLLANQGAGRMNEVFFEATFDSAQALAEREAAESTHPDLMAALGEVLRLCVPGSIVDRQLSAI